MRKAMAMLHWPAIGALMLASGCGELPLGGGRNGNAGSESGNSAQGAQGAPAPSDQCAAPANWSTAQVVAGGQSNTLAIARTGAMSWNGTAIDRVQLRQYLDITATLRPTPSFVLTVEPGAPCAQVSAVVEMASRTLNCASLCAYRDGGALPVRDASGGRGPDMTNQTETNLLQ